MSSRGHLESSLPPGLLGSNKTALRKEPSYEMKQNGLFAFGPHTLWFARSFQRAVIIPYPRATGSPRQGAGSKASWLGPAQPSA